ncbi:MAG TPA: pyridoxal phosphate-dependent aminotransferase [Thermoanaerobaculia bacterium]|nr:pyridoxal phosphate-dependent aminotransferase [Thermoanaerobaculia bacterium]
MTRARAPYMEWARHRPAPEVDLAGSNLLPCGLDDLPGAREALDIAGESPDGYAPLVEAIARRYGVAADRVATAGGCSGANFLTCAALVDAGDHVLLEHPVYDPLVAAAKMVGAEVSFFERRFEDGYALDPVRIAAALKPKTRLVVLSSPHNPSGVLAEESALRNLARVAEKADIRVLVDEVYLDAALGSKHPPAAALSPAFISSNSLTKSWGLASLRCGWTLASAEITERIRRARDIVDVWAPIPADRLSVLAFRNLDQLAVRARALIEANSRLIGDFFAGRRELECVPSRSTIAFPRFRDGRDSGPFADRLFRDHRVAVAPGRFFDSPAHFRLSFGGATEKLRRGLAAIAACLEAF